MGGQSMELLVNRANVVPNNGAILFDSINAEYIEMIAYGVHVKIKQT